MAKKPNPNTRPDPYPAEFDADSVREQIDADTGALRQHERGLAKLDRDAGPEKGGR